MKCLRSIARYVGDRKIPSAIYKVRLNKTKLQIKWMLC